MISIEPLLPHVISFLLVFTRLAGLFIFAPVLSSRSVPMRARAMVAMAFAVVVYPIVPVSIQTPPHMGLFDLAPLIVSEMLIGAAIGAIASIPLLAMEMAGAIAGHQMGLSLARAYNPELETSVDVAGQMLFYIAGAVFLAIGGLDALFLSIVRSFDHVPLGVMDAELLPLDLFVGVLSSGTELALRVALPVVGTLILILIALGFVMKTMPQINVLSVGFALKVLAGIAVLAMSVQTIREVAGDEVARVGRITLQWVDELGQPGDAP